MSNRLLAITTATALLLGSAAAHAETTLSVLYASPDLFNAVHEEIAKQFMAKHPDIKITFLAPGKEYEDVNQMVLRGAVTNQLPDVTYQGLNRQRVIADRNLAVDLGTFIAQEPNWAQAGYDGSLLTLGQVQGKQVGMGFSISTPIIYYNADLVRAAGGDPNNFPTTWDGIFELARKLDKPADKITGFKFDWDITGNWMFQALVYAQAGSMLTPDEKKVAFDAEPGQKAMAELGRMVTDGKMPDFSIATSIQDFTAGRLGIWSHSTSQLGNVTRTIGKTFELRTARFPLGAGADSRLPAGGNAAMILTKDPAKQKAAWEYIKFATGPIGATIMVKGTGYFPANTLPAKDPALLADFYQANPNHLVAIGQLPVLTAWYAFPGDNGLKITDVLKDHLQSVVNRSAQPEPTLKKMAADVQALLPK